MLEQTLTPTVVHDARVAIGRLRALLLALKPYWHTHLCRRALHGLVGLYRELADVREADVRVTLLTRVLKRARMIAVKDRRAVLMRAASDRVMARNQLSRRIGALSWRLSRVACTEALERLARAPKPRHLTRVVLAYQWQELLRRLCWRGASSSRALHRVRIFAPAWMRRLRDLQECLGELHDADALEEWFAGANFDSPAAGAVLESLTQECRARRRQVARLRGHFLEHFATAQAAGPRSLVSDVPYGGRSLFGE